MLFRSFRWQAQQQGLAVDSVTLVLLDRDGRPTRKWDASEQEAMFRKEYAHLDTVMPDGATLTYSNDCDVSGFGVTAPGQIVAVPTPTSTIADDAIGDLFTPAPTPDAPFVTVPQEDA